MEIQRAPMSRRVIVVKERYKSEDRLRDLSAKLPVMPEGIESHALVLAYRLEVERWFQCDRLVSISNLP